MSTMNLNDFRNYVQQFKGCGLNRIYLHWSAGRYTNIEDAYHISIGKDGDINVMHPLDKVLAATWKRNTGSVSVSMMCCFDAVCYSRSNVDFGSEPPTMAQIEAMSKVVCILCEELGLEMTARDVLTHSEIADIDGYGVGGPDPDMRWDLLLLQDSDGVLKPGGDVIRGKAIWYHYHPEDL